MVSFRVLLLNLVAPIVTSLKVTITRADSYFYESWKMSELILFLEHSRCNLTALTIEGIKTTSDALKSLLKLVPTVVHFTLLENESSTYTPYLGGYSASYGYYSSDDDGDWVVSTTSPCSVSGVDDDLLRSMSVTSDHSELLLPRLERLILSVHGDAFQDSALVEMIASRRRQSTSAAGTMLGSLQLKLTRREVSEDFVAQILEMRKKGLRVSVTDLKGCRTDQELIKLIEEV
ncbi:hypothetical protein BT96DRAFT_371 [Gymnopus androsaceus JB14]|uniref:FBD domain-containing protein n=1 Tax=Gymnopus androsaceus JB14 TaxID=1447944 RepID=A0A6A4IP77_9AGAR|nr:hypothetical protein BT96DRAFT_371 [Gymnopus androsaceus JB14]